jgi:hypothetical protein
MLDDVASWGIFCNVFAVKRHIFIKRFEGPNRSLHRSARQDPACIALQHNSVSASAWPAFVGRLFGVYRAIGKPNMHVNCRYTDNFVFQFHHAARRDANKKGARRIRLLRADFQVDSQKFGKEPLHHRRRFFAALFCGRVLTRGLLVWFKMVKRLLCDRL